MSILGRAFSSQRWWFLQWVLVLLLSNALFLLVNGDGEKITIFEIRDAGGDEYGSYPKADPYRPWHGHFDFAGLWVSYDDTGRTHFDIEMERPFKNSWGGGDGFSLQLFQIYIDTDGVSKGKGEKKSLQDAFVSFERSFEWDYVITFDGWRRSVRSSLDELVNNAELRVKATGKALNVTVRLGETPTEDWTYVLMVGAEDFGKFRDHRVLSNDWYFGGGMDSTVDPNVVDIFMPAGLSEDELNQLNVMQSYCLARNTYAIVPAIGPKIPRLSVGTIAEIRACEVEMLRLSGEIPGVNNPYRITNVKDQYWGLEADLEFDSSLPTPVYPDDSGIPELENAKKLKLVVYYETEYRINVKIFDPTQTRWQVPHVKVNPELSDTSRKRPHNLHYHVELSRDGFFGFSVQRHTKNGTHCDVLFNTTAPFPKERKGGWFPGLVWKTSKRKNSPVSYIEISTKLELEHHDYHPFPHLYGFGERSGKLHLKTDGLQLYSIWNRDRNGIPEEKNLYGSHPFYLELQHGQAHGVMLLNSNAMDIIVSKKTLQYKIAGGILDFYFFLGPTPEEVVRQYHEIIGKPHLIPFWGLGFHQAREGYSSIEEVEGVLSNFDSFRIPLDTLWLDTEYMDDKRAFTTDTSSFAMPFLRALAVDLHDHEQHLVAVVHPGLKVDDDLLAFREAKEFDLLIKNGDGSKPAYGMATHGVVAFPDFSHQNISGYWTSLIRKLHNMFPYDGLWLDRNEISSECSGRCLLSSDYEGADCECVIRRSVEENDPPIKPGGDAVDENTISMVARHFLGSEYNLHNLYGHLQALHTRKALDETLKRRALLLTRSNFIGTGHYAGHTMGQNLATFEDMEASIPGLLGMNIFGIPFSGADICGYRGQPDPELCARWYALGAFYPFARAHSSAADPPQEAFTFSDYVTNITRHSLNTRYRLLSYYYTLFLHAHIYGGTVVRPLFFEFPDDPATTVIEGQFMIGSALMLAPALTRAPWVVTYFPLANWYRFFGGAQLTVYNQLVEERRGYNGAYATLDTPMHTINLFIRGGHIVPTQTPALTSRSTRRNAFEMIVALDSTGTATGSLLADDGESLTSIAEGNFLNVTFEANYVENEGYFVSRAVKTDWIPPKHATVQTIIIYGVRLPGEAEAVYDEEVEEPPSIERVPDVLDYSIFSGCVEGKDLPPKDIFYNPKKKVLTIQLHKRPLNEDLQVLFYAGQSSKCSAAYRTFEMAAVLALCLLVLVLLFIIFSRTDDTDKRRHKD